VIETKTCGTVTIDTQDLRDQYAGLLAAPMRCAMKRPGRRAPSDLVVARLLSSVPVLCDEVDRLSAVLSLARRDHHDLVAAAQATLAAAAEGEADPLYYVRDELRARGLLGARRGDRSW
jgi:hypothetical protein